MAVAKCWLGPVTVALDTASSAAVGCDSTTVVWPRECSEAAGLRSRVQPNTCQSLTRRGVLRSMWAVGCPISPVDPCWRFEGRACLLLEDCNMHQCLKLSCIVVCLVDYKSLSVGS